MTKTISIFAIVLTSSFLLSLQASHAQSRGECTKRCGGRTGGCAVNTVAVQACFNKCMGTNECPVGQTKKKK